MERPLTRQATLGLLERQLEAVQRTRSAVMDARWKQSMVAAQQCLDLGAALVGEAGRVQAERAVLHARLTRQLSDLDREVVHRFESWVKRSLIGRDPVFDAGIEAGVQGLLALAHVHFNAEHSQSARPAASSPSERASTMEADYRGRVADLFAGSVSEGARHPSTKHRAQVLGTWCIQAVPRLASVAAELDGEYQQALGDGRGRGAQAVGRRLTELTALVRELVATFAACQVWVACAGERADALDELDRGRERLQPFSPLVGGTDTALAHLGEGSGHVAVEGVVETVNAFRDDQNRLQTRATLYDPSSGAKALLRLDFVHLPHLGIGSGAFLRASGQAEVAAGGEVLVKVERLPLAQRAETDFRLALLSLARPWFRPWPNGLHFAWSWQRHRGEGPRGANELRYGKSLRLAEGRSA